MKVQNRKCFVTKYSITGTGSGFHNLEEKKQKALETLPLSSYFVCSLRCLGRDLMMTSVIAVIALCSL